MTAAVAAAKAAFADWKEVPVQQRMRVMLKYQARARGPITRCTCLCVSLCSHGSRVVYTCASVGAVWLSVYVFLPLPGFVSSP
jgi:hypothetical protein